LTARKIAQENGWPALGASLRELHSVNDYLVQAVHGLLNRPTTAPPGPGFAGEGVWWAILPVQPEVLRLTQEDGRRINLTKSDSRLAAASGGGRIACGTG